MGGMTHTVSVIIAAFDAEACLHRPAQSLLQQSYPHWEAIIASDDGVDYAACLARHGIVDGRFRFTSTGKNGSGPSVARNAALRVATGRFAAVLDCDDRMAPEKLEIMLPLAERHGAVTSAIRTIVESTGEVLPGLGRMPDKPLADPAAFIRANIDCFSTTVWDRHQTNPAWDESLYFAEDLIHGLCFYNDIENMHVCDAALHDYYKRPRSLTYRLNERSLPPGIMASPRQDLIARARRGDLPVTNAAARESLIRMQQRWQQMVSLFADDGPHDPVLGFYRFMQRNQAAFMAW